MTAESVKRMIIVPRDGERSPSLAVQCGLAILRQWGGYKDYAIFIDVGSDDVRILDRDVDHVFQNEGLSSEEIFVGKNPVLFFATLFLEHISNFDEIRNLRSFQYNLEQYIQDGLCGDKWSDQFKTWEARDPLEVIDEIESVLLSIARRGEVTTV